MGPFSREAWASKNKVDKKESVIKKEVEEEEEGGRRKDEQEKEREELPIGRRATNRNDRLIKHVHHGDKRTLFIFSFRRGGEDGGEKFL